MKTMSSEALLKDLHELINAARQDVARQVNSSLVLLCWGVGRRLRQNFVLAGIAQNEKPKAQGNRVNGLVLEVWNRLYNFRKIDA